MPIAFYRFAGEKKHVVERNAVSIYLLNRL
jgi:hypothetical protein